MNRMISKLAAVLLLTIFVVPMAQAATWEIDPSHSAVTFKVRHFFSNAVGNFTDWSGTIEFDPEYPTKGSVNVTIQTASVNTDSEDRDNHLKSPDFFSVEEFPTITFKSTAVRKTDDGMVMDGDLTLKGKTKKVTIPFEFLGAGPDGWGGTRAGFSGKVTINRQDFGMKWNKVLDTGGAVLGEDVKIDLEIEAVKAVKATEAVKATAG